MALGFLAEASKVLAGPLPLEETLRRIAGLAVPRLADWCIVDLLEEGRIRRAAVRHADPAKADVCARLSRLAPDEAAPDGVSEALRRNTNVARVSAGTTPMLGSSDPEQVRLFAALGVSSYATFLLRSRDQVLGALTLVASTPERTLVPADLVLAQELADRAGLAVDNARLLAEAHRSAERLRLALANASLGAWEWRVSTDELWLDAGAMALLTGETREWHGKRDELHRWIHPDDVPRLRDELTRPEDGGASTTEFRVIREDRSVRWLRSRGRFPENGDGGRERMSGILEDVTLLKQTETELHHALQLRDEFLSIASHELNTPMTALQLNLQMLQRRLARAPAGTEGEQVEKAMRSMVGQVERMSRLLNQLLDVSRIRNDRLHLDREALDLGAAVAEVVERLRPLAARQGAEVRLSVPPEPVVGYWDRVRLEQVVSNLLSNALKYGREKPVEVAVRSDGTNAVLSVTDRGIGMAKADLARIFQRFERATAIRRAESLGLGLFITREIVRAHGGRIEVESEPGQGTTFRVRLPLRQLASAE